MICWANVVNEQDSSWQRTHAFILGRLSSAVETHARENYTWFYPHGRIQALQGKFKNKELALLFLAPIGIANLSLIRSFVVTCLTFASVWNVCAQNIPSQKLPSKCCTTLQIRALFSKIAFLNPKESENGFCVSLLNRSIQLISRIMVHQRNRRIHSGNGFFGSFWRTMVRVILD